MSDKFILFLADNIDTVMIIIASLLITSGVMNKNTEITMIGCTVAIMAMMLTIFV